MQSTTTTEEPDKSGDEKRKTSGQLKPVPAKVVSRVTFRGVRSAQTEGAATKEDEAESLMGDGRSKTQERTKPKLPSLDEGLVPTREGLHPDPRFPSTVELEHAFKDPTLLTPAAKAAVFGQGKFIPTFDSAFGKLLAPKTKVKPEDGEAGAKERANRRGKPPAAKAESPVTGGQSIPTKGRRSQGKLAQTVKEARSSLSAEESKSKEKEVSSTVEKGPPLSLIHI